MEKVIYCCGCKEEVNASLTDGAEIYPHRADLKKLPFWKCTTCNNYVGCHHKTKDRTKPLGCIPTPELRKRRNFIHSILDPLWKSKQYTRRELYTEISRKLSKDFHTSEIRSDEEANQIIAIISKMRNRKSLWKI